MFVIERPPGSLGPLHRAPENRWVFEPSNPIPFWLTPKSKLHLEDPPLLGWSERSIREESNLLASVISDALRDLLYRVRDGR